MSWMADRVARQAERRTPILLLVVGLIVELAARAVWAVLRRPVLILAAAVVAGVWWLVDAAGALPAAAIGVGTILLGLGGLAERCQRRGISWGDQAVTSWRRVRYARRWDRAMRDAGLAQLNDDGAAVHPRLLSVRLGGGPGERDTDVVRVHGLPGQVLTDWRTAAPRIASALDVRRARVHPEPGTSRTFVLMLNRLRDPVRRADGSWSPHPPVRELSPSTDPQTVENPVDGGGKQPATPPAGISPGMPSGAFPRAPRGDR